MELSASELKEFLKIKKLMRYKWLNIALTFFCIAGAIWCSVLELEYTVTFLIAAIVSSLSTCSLLISSTHMIQIAEKLIHSNAKNLKQMSALQK
jgi:hypothetical protein